MSDLIKAIFLDTNVFENAKFDYEDNNLEKFFNFCKKNKIQILINNVVLGEIQHRISENANKIVSGLSHEILDTGEGKKVKTRKDNLLYLSRVFNIPSNSKEIKDKIEKQLIEDFNYIKNEYITIISTIVDAQEVMKLYFEVKPPFEAGKKKEEFPDAIIGFDIRNYSKENDIKILTITNDNGLSKYLDSEALENAPKVTNALHILIEQSEEMNNERVTSIIKNNKKTIIDFIKDNIDLCIYSYDFENTVNSDSQKITSLIVDNIDILEILNEEEEGLSFEISCQCTVDIEVVTDIYPDYDTGMRDKETDTWYYYTTLQSTHTLTDTIDIDIFIDIIDSDNDNVFEMDNETGTIDIEYDLYDESQIIDKRHFESI